MSQQRGFSLMELLVAVVLGWLVIAALFGLDMAASRAGRLLAAQTQMDEDGQIGLQLLSNELIQAGYASPLSVNPQADAQGQRRFRRTFEGAPVFGCAYGFAVPGSTGEVACASAVAASAGLEVRYEADAFNTIPTVSTGLPGDCLGNGLSPSLGTGAVSVAYNRYFVEASSSGRPELKCVSRAGGAQPLVENVEQLQVWYGVATAAHPRQIVRYANAGAVGDFSLVVAVRLCLLLRSQDPVLSVEEAQVFTYADCDQAARPSTDRRLRKAYVTSVALRNKMPL